MPTPRRGAPGRSFAAYVRSLTLESDPTRAKAGRRRALAGAVQGAPPERSASDASEKAEAKGLALLAAAQARRLVGRQRPTPRFFAYAMDTSLRLVSALHGQHDEPICSGDRSSSTTSTRFGPPDTWKRWPTRSAGDRRSGRRALVRAEHAGRSTPSRLWSERWSASPPPPAPHGALPGRVLTFPPGRSEAVAKDLRAASASLMSDGSHAVGAVIEEELRPRGRLHDSRRSRSRGRWRPPWRSGASASHGARRSSPRRRPRASLRSKKLWLPLGRTGRHHRPGERAHRRRRHPDGEGAGRAPSLTLATKTITARGSVALSLPFAGVGSGLPPSPRRKRSLTRPSGPRDATIAIARRECRVAWYHAGRREDSAQSAIDAAVRPERNRRALAELFEQQRASSSIWRATAGGRYGIDRAGRTPSEPSSQLSAELRALLGLRATAFGAGCAPDAALRGNARDMAGTTRGLRRSKSPSRKRSARRGSAR